MGSSHSSYESAFDEVGTKCKWQKGLIIDIAGREKLRVADIRPLHEQSDETLKIYDDVMGVTYIYYYKGNNIAVDPFDLAPVYEITITSIHDAKIGGGRRNVENINGADLIEFNDDKPNFLREASHPLDMHTKNIFRSVDGRPPHIPSIKYPDEHPDDNIADE